MLPHSSNGILLFASDFEIAILWGVFCPGSNVMLTRPIILSPRKTLEALSGKPGYHEGLQLLQFFIVIFIVAWYLRCLWVPRGFSFWVVAIMSDEWTELLMISKATCIITLLWFWLWGKADTTKLTGPQTLADKRWVGPVKLLCIIMFNISKIRPKSILGPVKAEKIPLWVWKGIWNQLYHVVCFVLLYIFMKSSFVVIQTRCCVS